MRGIKLLTDLAVVDPEEARRVLREAFERAGRSIKRMRSELGYSETRINALLAQLGLREEFRGKREQLARRFADPRQARGPRGIIRS